MQMSQFWLTYGPNQMTDVHDTKANGQRRNQNILKNIQQAYFLE